LLFSQAYNGLVKLHTNEYQVIWNIQLIVSLNVVMDREMGMKDLEDGL
jgi:hypothetical protein